MAQAQTDEFSPPRRWLKPVAVLVLLAAAVVGAWLGWRHWQVGRLVRQADALVQQGDFRNAVLALQRALQIAPGSADAARGMAELTDKLQLPATVDWRRAAAEFSPGSAPAALDWATSALKFREPASAAQALETVPASERDTARFQTAAGTAAMGAGRADEARKHFARAAELDPDNELCQYNLATIRLQSPSAEERRLGAGVLEKLATNGKVDLFARRALIARAARDRKLEEALRWSSEVMDNPAATFHDRVTHLDLLAALQRPELPAALAEAQEKARGESPEDIAALLNWMRVRQAAAEALRWVEMLEPLLAGHPRVAAARAECLIALRDWPGLHAVAEKPGWEDLEYLRFAYLARVAREQESAFEVPRLWSNAINAARNRDQASRLALVAARWGWKLELRKLLSETMNQPASEWAAQMLHRICLAEGDTAGLLRVAERTAEANPANAVARNNVAMLSLLLRRDREKSLTTAQELHRTAPGNPTFASTYAFALHESGRSAEGLAVLKTLPPEKLREPSIAAYFGLLLAANDAADQATPFLELAQQAPLLPEEKALVAQHLAVPRK